MVRLWFMGVEICEHRLDRPFDTWDERTRSQNTLKLSASLRPTFGKGKIGLSPDDMLDCIHELLARHRMEDYGDGDYLINSYDAHRFYSVRGMSLMIRSGGIVTGQAVARLRSMKANCRWA